MSWNEVEYKFHPESIEDYWIEKDAKGNKAIIFDKDDYETEEEAQAEYKRALDYYNDAEQYMHDYCKYIEYKNCAYPARYNIEKRIFEGQGLIENIKFEKSEIYWWNDSDLVNIDNDY